MSVRLLNPLLTFIFMRVILVFSFFLLLFSCKKEPNAQQIVDRAIEYAGGEKIDNSRIRFEFRDRTYLVDRLTDKWKMEREFSDSLDHVTDRYDEAGFQRYLNEKPIEIADSMAFKYIESINSVIYFALLPYKLNDPAVQKEYLGMDTLSDKIYYLIKVSFQKEGGGEDFQDEFIYWFQIEDFSLDYLAYSFQTNGGGIRFREAYNERFVKGIRFVDYRNYKAKAAKLSLENLSSAFKENDLELLSTIELKNITVDTLIQ